MKIGNSPDKAALVQTSGDAKVKGQAAHKTASPVGANAAAAAKQATHTPAAQPAQEASAQVALSKTATSLLEGTGASGASSEGSFDTAKVNRIAQAISEGKFTVNAEAIADKLIANAHEVLGKVSH